MQREDYHLAALALSLVSGMGATTARQACTLAGSPPAVWEADAAYWRKTLRLGAQALSNFGQETLWQEAERIYERCLREDWQICIYGQANYPQRLLAYEDAPFLLYYKGRAGLQYGRFVGIVGTRSPSDYGLRACERLVEGLQPYQPLIVSGLAYGIDAAAHRKALDLGLESIAVLGHGLDRVYPALHRSLAQALCEQGGLLSEYPPGGRPAREHFPMRNRIIAGLSDALVVVETGEGGGSIISADYASQYRKNVFAFPGRNDDPLSKGCNRLIQSHRADLLLEAEDIAQALHWSPQVQSSAVQKQLFLELSPEEQALLRLFGGRERLHLEELLQAMGQTTSRLSALLLEMELKGLLRSLPGNFYAQA